MADDRTNRDDDEVVPNEGIRLIGADEAAQARERDDVARRRGDDELRPGDRPASQQYEGPAPKLSFPLSNEDAESMERPPLADDVELPHWTEPPTGEVPAALRGEDDDWAGDAADDEWSSFTGSTPRWRDSDADYEDEDVSYLRDDERPGALDDSDRPKESDFFSFDDLDEAPAGRSVFADDRDHEQYYEDDIDDGVAPAHLAGGGTRRVVIGSGADRDSEPIVPDSGGRNVPQAVGVGVAFGVVALICFALGPATSLALVLVVVTLASVEFLNALRRVGFEPVTLLGIVATAAMIFAAYHRGEGAIPAVLFLTTVVALLWYLAGAGAQQPTLNIGVTVLGVLWVGMFGSFAGLMLSAPHGVGLLLGAVIATVGYDVGGFFVGKNAGSRRLSPASPNKTWEGLIGGCVLAFVVAVAIAARFEPWGDFADAAKLGLVVLVAAPLGDLCQSLLKRDLGIKDMGTILPGHGGLLDRFDAMLFVLPAVYYLARVSDFFV